MKVRAMRNKRDTNEQSGDKQQLSSGNTDHRLEKQSYQKGVGVFSS